MDVATSLKLFLDPKCQYTSILQLTHLFHKSCGLYEVIKYKFYYLIYLEAIVRLI